jgi:hypothetical protein
VRLLDGFTVGENLRVSNPDVHPRELTTGEAAPEDPFLRLMKRAPYRTHMGGLDIVLDRVERDNGILAGLNVFLWRRVGAGGGHVASLQLKQRPAQDDHLELRWNGARALSDANRPELDDELWAKLPAVEWDEEGKTAYTLAAWADVVTTVYEEPETAEPDAGEFPGQQATSA